MVQDNLCFCCPKYDGPKRGAGDFVAVGLNMVGADKIARCISKITGKPCGCNERRTEMNERWPCKNKDDSKT